MGWASPNLDRLASENSTIFLPEGTSWMAACSGIGGIIGAILGAIFIELIGSKSTIVLSLLFDCAQWSCLIVANSSVWIYASRLIGGSSAAIDFSCFSLYLAEVTEPEIRGACISIAVVGSVIGLVFGTVAETYLYSMSSYLYLTTCLLGILMLAWLMDSPYYLVKRNNILKAKKAIEFYHPERNIEFELNEIKIYVEMDADMKSKLEELKVPVIRKSLLLIIILCCLPGLSGVQSLVHYMETILKKAHFDLIEPQNFVICSNSLAILGSFLPVVMIDRFGRRILLIVSSIGTATSMIGLGIHFFLIDALYIENRLLQWIPITFILLSAFAYTIGLQTIPSTVLSEIFPNKIKNIAACISTIAFASAAAISMKTYDPMAKSLGEAYVFWIYAAMSLIAVPVALFLMPETKGKSLQQIQMELMKSKKIGM